MASSEYIQHGGRPGSWSPAGFLTAVVVILVDMYFVGQHSANRDNVGIRLAMSPAHNRRIIATVYLFAAAFSAYLVMSYQDQYFHDVAELGLRNRKGMPQSVYPWFYELVFPWQPCLSFVFTDTCIENTWTGCHRCFR